MTDKLGNRLTQTTESSTLEIATPPTKTNAKLSHAVVQKDNVQDHNENPTPIIITQTENSKQDILTAVTSVQTEKIFVITEQDFLQFSKTKNITENDLKTLEIIKNSGVKRGELQKQIEKIKKSKQLNNDSDCVVIDLENDLELEQSKRNKYFLLSRSNALAHARLTAASQQSLVRLGNSSVSHETSSQATSNPDMHSVTHDQIITTPEVVVLNTPLSESSPTNPLDLSIKNAEATPFEIRNPFQPSVTCHEPLRSSAVKQPTEINRAFAKAPTTTEALYRNNGTCSDLTSQTAMAPSTLLAPSPTNSFARAHPERTYNTLRSFRKSRLRPDTVETLSTAVITTTQEKYTNKKRKTTPDRDTNIVNPGTSHSNLQQSPIQSDGDTAIVSIVQELRRIQAAAQRKQQYQELPIHQANQIPMLIQQSQMQHAGHGRHEPSGQNVSLARKMQQLRAQYAQTGNQQHPERDRLSAKNIVNIVPQQKQLPSPVQLLYPSEQGRQSLPSPSQALAQPTPAPEELYPSEKRQQLEPSTSSTQTQPISPPKHLYASEQRRQLVSNMSHAQAQPIPLPEELYPSEKRQQLEPSTSSTQTQPISPPKHLYASEQRRQLVSNMSHAQAQPIPLPEELNPSEKRQQPVPNMSHAQAQPIQHLYPREQRRQPVPGPPRTETLPIPPPKHLYASEQRRQLVSNMSHAQAQPIPLPEELYPSEKRQQLETSTSSTQTQPISLPKHLYASEQRRQLVSNMSHAQAQPIPLPEELYPSEKRQQPVPNMPQAQARPVPPLEDLYSSQPSHPQPSQIPVEPPRRVFSTELANLQAEAIQQIHNWHYLTLFDHNL